MKLQELIQTVGQRGGFGRRKVVVGPPLLQRAVRFPYGPFQFKSRVPKGAEYTVEASTNLRDWKAISDGVSRAEEFEYLDSEAFKFSYRFYRLVVEEVQSLNVIGYAAVMLPPGFSMIANTLEAPSSTVAEMFKGWPDGASLSRFDNSAFRLAENFVKFGKWTNPGERLQPGEGAIFCNPTSDYKSLSFVAEVPQGTVSLPIPAGFSIRSSLVPQPGSLEELDFPISDGDVIHLFDRDRQKYVLHPFEGGRWTEGAPVVSVGESFWVAKAKPGNWTRTLALE